MADGRLEPLPDQTPLDDYDAIAGEFVPYAPESSPEPPTIEMAVVANAAVAVGKFIGAGVWFVLAIPIAVVVHVGMALFAPSKPEPPNEAYGSKRPQRTRRVTYEKETFYQREKITIE